MSGGMFENDLIQTLEQGSNLTVEWFRKNNMIVNPDKFQAMLFQKDNNHKQSHRLQAINRFCKIIKEQN